MKLADLSKSPVLQAMRTACRAAKRHPKTTSGLLALTLVLAGSAGWAGREASRQLAITCPEIVEAAKDYQSNPECRPGFVSRTLFGSGALAQVRGAMSCGHLGKHEPGTGTIYYYEQLGSYLLLGEAKPHLTRGVAACEIRRGANFFLP